MKNTILNLPDHIICSVSSEVDMYGFSFLIRSLSEIHTYKYSKGGGWRHGWHHTQLKYPKQILHPDSNRDDMYYVRNKYEEEFLKNNGFSNIISAGLPFVYTDYLNLDVQARPKSLLVMPGHVLITTQLKSNIQVIEESYIKEILAYRDYFSEIVFCLSSHCIRRGLWVETLKKYNIPFIEGADVNDQNALKRMRIIFESFEYMTGNRLGSHFLYAAYCGCKVSLYGDFELVDKFVEKRYDENEEMAAYVNSFLTFDKQRELYPFFDCEAHKASQNIEWAEKEIGKEFMLEPAEIAELLGWNDKRYQRYLTAKDELLNCEKSQYFKRFKNHLIKSFNKSVPR